MSNYIEEIRALHLEEENRPYRPKVKIETAVLAWGSKMEIPEGQTVRLTKGGDPDKRYLPRSPEYREYISRYMKEMYQRNPDLAYQRGMNMVNANTGKPWSEQRRKDRSELQKNYIWITNGTDNTRVRKDSQIPEGWRRGRSGIDTEWRKKISDSIHTNHLKKMEEQNGLQTVDRTVEPV